MGTHRYRFTGPTDAFLESVLGAGAVVGGPSCPALCVLRELDSEALLTDLDWEMARAGFVRDDASMQVPPSLLQIKRDKLTSDAPAISGASFETVLSAEITTRGGTVLQVRASLVANTVDGGTTRIVIDGGPFSDLVILTSSHPVLSNALGGGESYVAIQATEDDVIYEVRVESASVVLGTLTPRAGSSLIVEEWSE